MANTHIVYDGTEYTLEHWRDVADQYADKAAEGGGWVDVVTVSGGLTLWAHPSIPITFTRF